MQVMLDIEALGQRQDSIILTIGAQLFDPTSEQPWLETDIYDPVSQEHVPSSLNVRVDVDEQERMGRVTEDATISWWSKQSAEAQEEAFGEQDRYSLKDALAQLVRMIQMAGPKKSVVVWSKGTTYDIVILENAMTMAGISPPWAFWNVRDARTIYSMCPNLNTRKNGPVSHRALDDCRNQIILLRDAFEILRITQPR